MRCREFLNNHVGYVDDVLSGAEMEAMHRHRELCPSCARHDAAVRRSLLVVRNLPVIHASPDFYERLQARIRAGAVLEDRGISRAYIPSIGNFAALAAGLAAVGYVAVQAVRSVMDASPPSAAAVATTTRLPSTTSLSFESPALASVIPSRLVDWPEPPMSADASDLRSTSAPIEQTSLTLAH